MPLVKKDPDTQGEFFFLITGIGIKRLVKKKKKKKRVDTTVDYAGVKSIKYYVELFLCQFKNAANETPPTVHRLFFFSSF